MLAIQIFSRVKPFSPSGTPVLGNRDRCHTPRGCYAKQEAIERQTKVNASTSIFLAANG